MIASSCNVCLLSLQRYERPHAALADTIATDITKHQSIVRLTDNDFHLLLQNRSRSVTVISRYTLIIRCYWEAQTKITEILYSLMSSSQVSQTVNRILWVKSLSFPLLCVCYYSVCTASSLYPRGHKSWPTEYQWTYFLWINWTGAISRKLSWDSWQGQWGTNSGLKPTESWADFVECETLRYFYCLLFEII